MDESLSSIFSSPLSKHSISPKQQQQQQQQQKGNNETAKRVCVRILELVDRASERLRQSRNYQNEQENLQRLMVGLRVLDLSLARMGAQLAWAKPIANKVLLAYAKVASSGPEKPAHA